MGIYYNFIKQAADVLRLGQALKGAVAKNPKAPLALDIKRTLANVRSPSSKGVRTATANEVDAVTSAHLNQSFLRNHNAQTELKKLVSSGRLPVEHANHIAGRPGRRRHFKNTLTGTPTPNRMRGPDALSASQRRRADKAYLIGKGVAPDIATRASNATAKLYLPMKFH